MKRILQLSDIAEYVDDTVRSDSIGLEQYVTTDSLLQNKEGRSLAANLPPKVASLVAFKKGDTLVANIRPYLKKIWLADCCGGASQDVLVFRARECVPQEYLFATLLQDAFFDYVMKAPKGSKMPRGDESHIMRFPLSQIDISDQRKIGKFLSSVDRLIELSRKRIENLEKLAKEIYDYWFVQFDFPDKNGKTYKSSGGKMVYNSALKREIPEGWEVNKLGDVISVNVHSYKENTLPETIGYVDISSVSNGVISSRAYYSRSDAPGRARRRVRDGDTVWSSVRPNLRAYALVLNPKENDVYSTGFVVLSPTKVPFSYLYLAATADAYVSFLVSRTGNSSYPAVLPDAFKEYLFPLPTEELLTRFHQITESVFRARQKSFDTISELTQLREFLLPLLMNGQVKMGEASGC